MEPENGPATTETHKPDNVVQPDKHFQERLLLATASKNISVPLHTF
jgi:hypothetical protein